jgi:hypothetical protein
MGGRAGGIGSPHICPHLSSDGTRPASRSRRPPSDARRSRIRCPVPSSEMVSWAGCVPMRWSAAAGHTPGSGRPPGSRGKVVPRATPVPTRGRTSTLHRLWETTRTQMALFSTPSGCGISLKEPEAPHDPSDTPAYYRISRARDGSREHLTRVATAGCSQRPGRLYRDAPGGPTVGHDCSCRPQVESASATSGDRGKER